MATQMEYRVGCIITRSYEKAQEMLANNYGKSIERIYTPIREKPATSEKFEQIMAKKRKENKW